MAADLSAPDPGVGGPVATLGSPAAPGDPTLRWSSRATTIPGIEHELARFWALPQARAAVAGPAERTIAARTSVLNLVVVARSPELGERAASTISMLTGRHPSRTLILVPTDPDGPAWLRAEVKAYCMMPRADAPETCAEQIYAAAGGETGRHLGAIVAPLLVHDLPVTLWWPGEPPLGTPLARDLIGMADRLAVDGSSWTGDGLDRLRALAALGGGSLAISDFALMRQARWREAVASVFDRPEFLPYLRSLRRVSVTYATHGGPDAEARTNIVKPIYHVAWLASRLGLRVVRPLERAGRPGAARRTSPGAGPEPGRGMRALLEWARGAEVEVVIRPVLSGMPGGTTLRVEILAERRGMELRAEVTAEAERVHVRVWEDGVEALQRSFAAPRRSDVDLLAEAIEAGGRDLVAEGASGMAAALAGPVASPGGESPTGTRPGRPAKATRASRANRRHEPRVAQPPGRTSLPGPGGSPGEPEILVAATPAAAARLAAERLAEAITGAVARYGRADVATTGGSTSPLLYRALLAPPIRERIPWDRLHLWFGDDRFVPRADPDSNLRAVDEVLLAGDSAAGLAAAPLPSANLHPVPVDVTLAAGGGPAEAAAAYESALRAALRADADGRPVFDAITVGIGPDGHLLSIFPGSAAFDAPGWVVPVAAPTHVTPRVARVSLTPGALDATPALVPMAFGAGKAAILAAVLAGPRDERRLPSQRARRAGATWILDAGAAASLPRP